MARLVAGLAGVIVATVSWLVLVPWDLSTVDEYYRDRHGGVNEKRALIIFALVAVFAVALIVALSRWYQLGPWLAFGGSMSWLALLAWRGAVARVSGANLYAAGVFMGAFGAGFVVLVTTAVSWLPQATILGRPRTPPVR